MFKIGDKVKFKKTSLESGMIDATEEDVFCVEGVHNEHWGVVATLEGYFYTINTAHLEHVKEKEIMEEKYIPKVGDKVVGFKFEDNHGSIPTWVPPMDKYIGQEGFVSGVEDVYFKIQFEDDWWNYPLSLAHLAKIEETEEDQEIKWEVGQEVFCLLRGKGVVSAVSPQVVDVQYPHGVNMYNFEGKPTTPGSTFRTLFFSEPKIIAEKFPPKKPFVPVLKEGDMVFVKHKNLYKECYTLEVNYEDDDAVWFKNENDGYLKSAWEFYEIGEEIKFEEN